MLRLARYRTWDELQELRPHWNSLLSQSASDTVFLTWQWIEAWWKNYGAGRKIFAIAAWDNGDLVGVAPLYIEEVRQYGKKCRRLRLIGDGTHDSDYLDCFVQHNREAEVAAAFTELLWAERESWDWIELNGPRKNSKYAAAFLECAQERSWKFRAHMIPCATLVLPRTWDEYLRKLEPRFRTKVRSSLATLHGAIRSAPVQCKTEQEIQLWLPSLFDLHTRRWASEDMPGVFRDPAKRVFYHDLSLAAFKQGWLAFHKLDWGERPLALQYGLLYRNRFHLLQEGYDPDFSAIRPGMALRAWLMQHWIELGLEEYDFLAGTARYKFEWGASETFSTRFLISAQRAGEMFSLRLPELQIQMRESFARITPDPVLGLRKKILSRSKKKEAPSDAERPTEHKMQVKGVARKIAVLAYSNTPFGMAGRTIATKYSWSRSREHWLGAFSRRNQTVVHIFQYHRVNDDGDPYLGGLPVDAFRSQMQYLARTFPIVTLDQIADGTFIQHSYCAAVTFDDGYRDNFVCAFPILKQLGIAGTIFLATGYIDAEQLPWYDQVRLAFKLTTRTQLSITDRNAPNGSMMDLSSRLRLMEQILGWMRGMPEAERRSAITEVNCALGVPRDLNLPNQMLRWEDIRQMSKHKISFGAHTVTHPVLSKTLATDLKREIEGSKHVIENRLQAPVSHFAYPFGQARDFDHQSKCAVRDAGFKTAVTTIWGLNEPGDDLLELKRFTPWETDLAAFKLKLDWFRFTQPQTLNEQSHRPKPASPLAQEAGI